MLRSLERLQPDAARIRAVCACPRLLAARARARQEPRVSKDFPKGRVLRASTSAGEVGPGAANAASRRSTGGVGPPPEQK